MSTGLITDNEQKFSDVEDMEFAVSFDEHLKAGYQVMYIPTTEESRVETEIVKVAAGRKMDLITWDCFEGFSFHNLPDSKKKEFRNPIVALESVLNENEWSSKTGLNHVFVFRDLDDFLVDPGVRRRIRSMAEGNRLVNNKFKRPLVIISPLMQIHPKLRSSITVIEFALPGEEKLKRQIEFVKQSVESRDKKKIEIDEELRDRLAVNLLGLTSNEAENCLSRCIVRHKGFKPEMLSTVKQEKAAIVKKSEVLTYIPEDSIRSRNEIGGFDLYMKWLDERKLAYTSAAIAQHIDFPRGVVLLGLPGTGKSMVAYTTCMILGLPGYVLDIGSLFGSLVGESEQRTRDALKQIDAQKGCVLVIDEADKALGNAHSSQGDSGVTRRVFGTILTWLAENKSRTFTIMTVNRTEGLPPELTRAGRFDALFYTDLPNDQERRQILEIQLRRRFVDPESLKFKPADWKSLTMATSGFVGSELEEVVRSARSTCFAATGNGTPTFESLIEAANSMRNMIMTARDPDGINTIRDFCKDKAMPVTTPLDIQQTGRVHRTVDVDN